MAKEEQPAADGDSVDALAELGVKLDTVAGAVAAIAATHTELLGQFAEAELRRSQDAVAAAQRLDALERQILALPAPIPPPPGAPGPEPASVGLEPVREDLALTLDVLNSIAEAVQSLSGRLPDIADDLRERLTLHTDVALAGALRLIDGRLSTLRAVVAEAGAQAGPGAGGSRVGGFEAGAVMGAAQAAWNRLEQRLDDEFDDLSRQLQAMANLVEQAVASTEAAANRPVVTGDQLRRAASAVKDSVVGASRSRRDRRGGPRGLGSG